MSFHFWLLLLTTASNSRLVINYLILYADVLSIMYHVIWISKCCNKLRLLTNYLLFISDFEYLYNPLMGNCYIYNPGIQPKHWSYRAGSLYGMQLLLIALLLFSFENFCDFIGLRMLLSVEQAEYICSSTTSGFRLLIHENQVIPYPDSAGYNVAMGTTTLYSMQTVQK